MKALSYGAHVWIRAGVVHPDQRLRGIIIQSICKTLPPEYHVAFVWPQEKHPSVWKLNAEDLDPMSAVDILAEIGQDEDG